MHKNWLANLFSSKKSASATGAAKPILWIEADKNPWRVPVLDVRPVTLGMLSTSRDPLMATNAISYGDEDGLGFLSLADALTGRETCEFEFKTDRILAEGVLFIPMCMEHKWAIFYHGKKILFVRSWTRQLMAAAEVEAMQDGVRIVSTMGRFSGDQESRDFTERILLFLIHAYVLNVDYPAPFPENLAKNPREAALWCFSMFGNKANVATHHEFDFTMPDLPLRTHSLLHIAIARGNRAEILSLLAKGNPVDLLAADGLSTLHWSLARDDQSIMELLLEQGCPVDVRSSEGATTLMTAVQGDASEARLSKVRFLLDHGADPNATDDRGFSTLHRVAESGRLEHVKLLLSRGAKLDVESQGYTPLAFARERGHAEVVEFLESFQK